MRVERSWRSLRRTPALVGGLAVTGAALGTGVLVIPCWFHALTGLDCPFCGGSRALGALLHGDPVAAIGYNAFAVLVLLPVAVVVLVALARWEVGRATRWWPAGARGLRLALLLGALTMAWWVLRDLPGLGWLRA
ncbi:uncharacterized protein DUF2752 [Amycolatopsis cihanbeyliensis]|uniref:Uncharacterized protein DUF2752 n=2 Tax=Amycolatopsis cihanbeyliensis TaxID=1128664 RepID=A0A542CTH0_AMYCI|nr:uncharacterized protein DUF2752 [Amycolatopsis cihanbeyliensis]